MEETSNQLSKTFLQVSTFPTFHLSFSRQVVLTQLRHLPNRFVQIPRKLRQRHQAKRRRDNLGLSIDRRWGCQARWKVLLENGRGRECWRMDEWGRRGRGEGDTRYPGVIGFLFSFDCRMIYIAIPRYTASPSMYFLMIHRYTQQHRKATGRFRWKGRGLTHLHRPIPL